MRRDEAFSLIISTGIGVGGGGVEANIGWMALYGSNPQWCSHEQRDTTKADPLVKPPYLRENTGRTRLLS
jgi:hypothetical protein